MTPEHLSDDLPQRAIMHGASLPWIAGQHDRLLFEDAHECDWVKAVAAGACLWLNEAQPDSGILPKQVGEALS
ncbi:MAG: hypothetical protein WAV92_02220 [Halopseudomonas yangmingensis]